MKYHALLFFFEKAAKFEIVVSCKLKVPLNGFRYIHLQTCVPPKIDLTLKVFVLDS